MKRNTVSAAALCAFLFSFSGTSVASEPPAAQAVVADAAFPTNMAFASDRRLYSLSRDPRADGAEALSSLPGATANSHSPPPTASGSPTPVSVRSNHFETYAAWAAGLLALILVMIGGMWFRGIARREDSRPDA